MKAGGGGAALLLLLLLLWPPSPSEAAGGKNKNKTEKTIGKSKLFNYFPTHPRIELPSPVPR